MEIEKTDIDWPTLDDTTLVALAGDAVPEALAELARRDAEETS